MSSRSLHSRSSSTDYQYDRSSTHESQLSSKEIFEKFKIPLIIVSIMIFIIVIAKIVSSQSKQYARSLNKDTIQTIVALKNKIQNLHLQSVQDSNPILAFMHSTQALQAYDVLKNTLLAGLARAEIQKLLDFDFNELYNFLQHHHQRALNRLGKHCPDISIDGIVI